MSKDLDRCPYCRFRDSPDCALFHFEGECVVPFSGVVYSHDDYRRLTKARKADIDARVERARKAANR